MKKSLYDEFPFIISNKIILRKIVKSDLDDIYEIYSNKNLFKYSPIMYTNNKNTVANMIGHFERDFLKRKCIFLGICLNNDPNKIVGIFEIFDYTKNINAITIGYRLNENYWGKGVASESVKAVTRYLFDDIGLNRIQAFVMPENVKSQNVLQRNGFIREGLIRQGHIWKRQGLVDLYIYSLLKTDAKRLN